MDQRQHAGRVDVHEIGDLARSVDRQIARELVAVMRRDVKTDWMVRDDVRADRQQGAIRVVIEQMEAMASRYAA